MMHIKSFCTALLVTAGIAGAVHAQEAVPNYTSRDQVDPKYTWDLTPIYATQQLWEADFSWVEDNLHVFSQYQGRLGESAGILLECLMFDDAVNIKLELLHLYAFLSRDLDYRNEKNQRMWERYGSLHSQVHTASAFIEPEILALPEERLWSFVNEKPEFEHYRHALENLSRSRVHILSRGEEEILSLATPVTEVSKNAFDLLISSDLVFPKVGDERGNEVEMTRPRHFTAMSSTDRDFRQRAHKAFLQPFIAHKHTLAALLYGTVKSGIFTTQARSYPSALQAALHPQNLPPDLYDNLVKSVGSNLSPLQRWAEIKKKALGVDKLRYCDLYATIFPTEKKEYSYERARAIITEALAPLGPAYGDALQRAFDERRIDVYSIPGKKSGSYSTSTTYGASPYILLNWGGQLSSIFGLVHELGHNLHAHFSATAQPSVYAAYPPFTGEVASTTAEAMLHDYMIGQAATNQEKMSYIEQYLNSLQLLLYWCGLMAELERDIYARVEAGEALTPEVICEMQSALFDRYWGGILESDTATAYVWTFTIHLYQLPFYIYNYATSVAAAEQIAANIREEPYLAAENYLEFLKTGGSEYAIDMLKKTGVDMTTPEPIIAVSTKMSQLLDQLEELMGDG